MQKSMVSTMMVNFHRCTGVATCWSLQSGAHTHLAMLKAQAFQNTGPAPPFICSHSREDAANPAPVSMLSTGTGFS